LINGNRWASAVEQALGNLLNAFIVTDHKDLVALRDCGKEAKYNNLKIIIYDFSRPRFKSEKHFPIFLFMFCFDEWIDLVILQTPWLLFMQVRYTKAHDSSNRTPNYSLCLAL
jgi:chromosome segregation ATPase